MHFFPGFGGTRQMGHGFQAGLSLGPRNEFLGERPGAAPCP